GKKSTGARLRGATRGTRRRQATGENRPPHHVLRRAGMTRNGITTALLGIVVIGGGSAPAGAQTTETRIKKLIGAAAGRIGAGQAPTAEPKQVPPGAPGAVVHMSLDDAVKLALDRNLDIAVQRLNPP